MSEQTAGFVERLTPKAMISQETKDQIGKEADEYARSLGSETTVRENYTYCALKYAEKLEEKDKAYNELGIKFDKEVERWQERDTDELEKRLALQTELAQLKEIAERMAKVIETWNKGGNYDAPNAFTAYAEWCKQNKD